MSPKVKPGRGEDRPGSWLTTEETELLNLLQSESDRERVTSELLHQVADHFDRTFIDQIMRANRKSFMMGVNPKRPWEPLK